MRHIIKEIEGAGLPVRAVPASHLPELAAELERLFNERAIGKELYEELTGFYRFAAPDGMVSVLTVATPSPILRLSFSLGGRLLHTLLPPTYAEYGQVQPAVEEQLNAILAPHGYRASWFKWLPQKMLAARSGLTRYGRNNIGYAEGMGSFVSLTAFVTDMPCEDDTWQEAARMERCSACAICRDRCPTGAISGRLVIDASRCLTQLNEPPSPGDAFPDWLDPAAHHCIVGCLRCQASCPENAAQLSNQSETVAFDEAETALILENCEYGLLPETLRDKLAAVGLRGYYSALPRNLKVLMR